MSTSILVHAAGIDRPSLRCGSYLSRRHHTLLGPPLRPRHRLRLRHRHLSRSRSSRRSVPPIPRPPHPHQTLPRRSSGRIVSPFRDIRRASNLPDAGRTCGIIAIDTRLSRKVMSLLASTDMHLSYGRLVRCDIPAPRSASSRL
jgi:hypothetical protein